MVYTFRWLTFIRVENIYNPYINKYMVEVAGQEGAVDNMEMVVRANEKEKEKEKLRGGIVILD